LRLSADGIRDRRPQDTKGRLFLYGFLAGIVGQQATAAQKGQRKG
jgi:hypothetical protein